MKQRAGSVLRLASPLRAWAQRFMLFALVGTAFALMLLGKTDTVLIEGARTAVTDAVAPIMSAVSRPVNTVNEGIRQVKELAALRAENADLRSRNERLLHWQMVARRLEAENEALRGLLRLVPDPRQRSQTARVIADQGGAFVRSVLVNAGESQGITRGQAALSREGLAGRITHVGGRASRVLLVTDMNSRIPVLVGGMRHRAVLAGDNSLQPSLLYLGPRVEVQPGETVVTSGHGGVLPADLPVGVVASVDERGVRVLPYTDWDHLEFLRLIAFEMPGLLTPASEGQ